MDVHPNGSNLLACMGGLDGKVPGHKVKKGSTLAFWPSWIRTEITYAQGEGSRHPGGRDAAAQGGDGKRGRIASPAPRRGGGGSSPTYAFSCLPFGWHLSPLICQYVLAFVTGSVDTSGVIVLHYVDDFPVVWHGWSRVGSVAQNLRKALRQAGAIINTKSVLDPVLEIQWLGKWLVLSGDGAGVFSKGRGGGGGCPARPLDLCSHRAPYQQACALYSGAVYLEYAAHCGLRPFSQWMVGSLLLGCQLAPKLPRLPSGVAFGWG